MASLKRRVADALGTLLNVEIVARPGAPYWPERFFLKRLFASLRPDCVFDVGANAGQYGQDLRALGFTGTILSFEPNPAVFARLDRACAGDPRWHAHPFALGREAGTTRFNVMAGDLFSSFRDPVDDAGAAFADANTVSRTIEVPVERLDVVLPTLAARHGFTNPFLKMDTQGFDLEVLAGAGDVAGRFCGLLSEVSARPLYAGAPAITESFAAFAAAGFEIAALHSVHPEEPLRPVEFNCYCVRRDLAGGGPAR